MILRVEAAEGYELLETLRLEDDGLVPNSSLPALIYRRILSAPARADQVQARFADHGWGRSWVNGIFGHHHYHSTAHEALGITRGRARVQLGGARGPVAEIEAGDVVVLPAGAGHRNLGGEGLEVVGAYPDGQAPDLCDATPAARDAALANLRTVPLPAQDPVFGGPGVLLGVWRP